MFDTTEKCLHESACKFVTNNKQNVKMRIN